MAEYCHNVARMLPFARTHARASRTSTPLVNCIVNDGLVKYSRSTIFGLVKWSVAC